MKRMQVKSGVVAVAAVAVLGSATALTAYGAASAGTLHRGAGVTGNGACSAERNARQDARDKRGDALRDLSEAKAQVKADDALLTKAYGPEAREQLKTKRQTDVATQVAAQQKVRKARHRFADATDALNDCLKRAQPTATATATAVATATATVTATATATTIAQANPCSTATTSYPFVPAALFFPDQTVNTSSADQISRMYNCTSAPATVYGYEIDNYLVFDKGDSADSCFDYPTTVPVGGYCTVAVHFTPDKTGPDTGAFRITLDSTTSDFLNVAGNGTP